MNELEDTLRGCSSDKDVKNALDNAYDIDGEFLGSDEVQELVKQNEKTFADLEFEK